MGIIPLSPAERTLLRHVEHGDPLIFPGQKQTISGEVLRHIVLGLALVDYGVRRGSAQAACRITGAGISLGNALIDGPLTLDAAIGEDSGPLCPMEFRNCAFTGGFFAAHAYFSRLSLRDCTFVDKGDRLEPATGRPRPTIDIAGARFDRQLDMEGVKPDEAAGRLLWIRAPGISIGGGLNLSRSKLSAPPKPAPAPGSTARPVEREDALDLTLAEIAGDFCLDDHSEVRGRVKLRGARIGGDMWLDEAAFLEAGKDNEVLFLQGACIKGFLSLTQPPGERAVPDCIGNVNMVAAEVGRSLLVKHIFIKGDVKAVDLAVRHDFYLHPHIEGHADLGRAAIGGSLDISRMRLCPPSERSSSETSKPATALSLNGGRIGGALRLRPKKSAAGREPDLQGIVDLTGLTCTMLDDGHGESWGTNVRILMNHFTYSRTGGPLKDPPPLPPSYRRRRKRSQKVFADWLLTNRADGNRPIRWLPRWSLPSPVDFWSPWQLRRNWIYRQYDSAATQRARADPYLSVSRHEIDEEDYHPQPFEQAIKVARAEGREDFATQFEMHKQYLEWKLFNERVRWGLGLAGIALAALWLVIGSSDKMERFVWTPLACLVTILLMIFGSVLRAALFRKAFRPALRTPRRAINGAVALIIALLLAMAVASGPFLWLVRGIAAVSAAVLLLVAGCGLAVPWAVPPGPETRAEWVARNSSRFLTWVIYWIPAGLLLIAFWWCQPFRFFIAMLIFVLIRWMAAIAHQLMRFGFGYLRQPIRAVVTLIGVFLIGWRGVGLANSHDMFVVAAEPVAGLVGLNYPPRETKGRPGDPRKPGGEDEAAGEPRRLMGSEPVETMNIAGEPQPARTAPPAGGGAADEVREGIRDISCRDEISEPLYALDVLVPIVDLGEEARCEIRRLPTSGHPVVKTEQLTLGQLVAQRGDWPLNDNRFWWWMKAVYAIAGWILVSLALLTFAQVNRTHGEPAE